MSWAKLDEILSSPPKPFQIDGGGKNRYKQLNLITLLGEGLWSGLILEDEGKPKVFFGLTKSIFFTLQMR